MQTPTKPTVMFADQVSTCGSTSLASASPLRQVKGGSNPDKRGYLNGLLIGLMGIVFGLGIMYLLSRLMQTTRKLAVVERQLKQHQMIVDDIGLQVEVMQHQREQQQQPFVLPRPPAPPAPAPPAFADAPPKRAPTPQAVKQPQFPLQTLFPPFEMAMGMADLPMFFEVLVDTQQQQQQGKVAHVEEVVEEEVKEAEKVEVAPQENATPPEADSDSSEDEQTAPALVVAPEVEQQQEQAAEPKQRKRAAPGRPRKK